MAPYFLQNVKRVAPKCQGHCPAYVIPVVKRRTGSLPVTSDLAKWKDYIEVTKLGKEIVERFREVSKSFPRRTSPKGMPSALSGLR